MGVVLLLQAVSGVEEGLSNRGRYGKLQLHHIHHAHTDSSIPDSKVAWGALSFSTAKSNFPKAFER